MKFKFVISVLLLVFIPLIISAGNYSGTLKGIIVDSETNEPVPNAVIKISEKESYLTTNIDGTFSIPKLEEGRYTFEVSHLAYDKNIITFLYSESSEKNLIIYLKPKSIEINQVVVSTGKSKSIFDDLSELSNVLKGRELERDMGQTLASTLKNETGLAIRSMGPAPARPVIRGLGSDRVLISEDGNKTTDLSASSPDHAVTIEPFSLKRIEVLRGPKVLLKTPTTIGGVVNVIRNEIPEEYHEHFYGMAGLYGESANKGYLGSVVVDVPYSNFIFRSEASKKNSEDLETPVGVLKNSYAENLNYSFGGSYFTDFGFIGASFRDFELDYGVPGGFIGAHPNGVDIEMFRQQYNFRTNIKFKSSVFDELDIHFSNVLYRHKEFESSGKIGSEFRIINNIGHADLNHNKFYIFNNGTVGASFELRDFTIGGFVFTPPTKSINVSTYFYETINADRFNFEFGGRYNFDNITPDKEKPNSNIGYIRERTFNTFSLSFSTVYEISKIVYVGFNLSKSSRVPTIEELFTEGPHLAAYSYEVGNPDLNDEKGFGTEIFVYHKFDKLYFNLNLFRNHLTNYIISRNTGEINYATFLPVYQSTGVEALFYGAETQIDWNFINNFSLSTSISYTRGKINGTNENLPQIPPVKGMIEIKYSKDDFAVSLNTEMADKQNRVDTFEEPTAGYMILNSSVQYSFKTENLIHNFSLNADNILNKEYRNHLSRVKSILPEAGRNFRLVYKLYFDI